MLDDTPDPPPAPLNFSYHAQSRDGAPLSGTIESADMDTARLRLESLGLRVIEMIPADPPPRPRPIRGADFAAFNQQLASLAQAGMPLEQGLRLIAQDMRSGRLARSVAQVCDELDRGVSLPQAIEHHRAQFPRLYARLVDAGVRSGRLPEMLLNLGAHLEMIARLRQALWRAMAYPVAVLATLIGVMAILLLYVVPRFEEIFQGFRTQVPAFTGTLFYLAHRLPLISAVVAAALVVCILGVWILAMMGINLGDQLLVHLPLIGRIVQKARLARWCDAMRLGIDAGIDLPGSLDLAADAVATPVLRRDAIVLHEAMMRGESLAAAATHLRAIPPTVIAAMSIAAVRNSLSQTLATLSRMYQQQAQHRIATIPAILSPLLLIVIGLIIVAVILAMFAPLLWLLRSVSGGGF